MALWKLLTAISLIAWYLPVLSFRNNKKYLPYFVVNSLVDPIYIGLHYTFHLGMYNYIPIALFFEAMTLPRIDAKSRTVSAVILLLVAFTTGTSGYLELIICESALALMVYYLLKDSFLEIKNDSAFKIFHLLLLIYFFRNGLMFYLYYIHQPVLINYYTVFLIIIIILPILIAYFGPEKKISISKKVAELLLFIPEYRSEISVPEMPNKKNGHGLTEREYEIFCLTLEGKTSREISEQLCISKKTVENHRVSIRQKLGIPKDVDFIEYCKKIAPTQKKISFN
jgi:DNA-binding CsgD family transcriptional regulator